MHFLLERVVSIAMLVQTHFDPSLFNVAGYSLYVNVGISLYIVIGMRMLHVFQVSKGDHQQRSHQIGQDSIPMYDSN